MVLSASMAAPPLNNTPFFAPLLMALNVAGVAEATNAQGWLLLVIPFLDKMLLGK